MLVRNLIILFFLGIASFEVHASSFKPLDKMIVEGAPMKAVMEMVAKVAGTDDTVLIQGETGTGKELIAQTVHMNSSRAHPEKPFKIINTAALPEDLIESTLFGYEKGAFTGA